MGPPKRPPNPVLASEKNTIAERLAAAEQLNLAWQKYNEEREIFVADLTRKAGRLKKRKYSEIL